MKKQLNDQKQEIDLLAKIDPFSTVESNDFISKHFYQ
jgi:hypothetical protein